MFEDVFIAIYTHECKAYCDDRFFENLLNSNTGDAKIMVVDNSDSDNYVKSLTSRFGNKIEFRHIIVGRDTPKVQFQRNVTESALHLRECFLKDEKYKYFIIMESDVLPEDPEWISEFMKVINKADILGGLYYFGFHAADLWVGEPRIEPTHHVLSGCTVYKREIIEKFPFRWSYENIGAFPDAWISYDVNKYNETAEKKYILANYTKIRCRHLEKSPGDRGHGECR